MKKIIALAVLVMVGVVLFSEESSARSVAVVIDSIEEGMVSVFFGDGQESFTVPADMFPGEVHEGMWYTVTVEFDQARTAAAIERIRRIIAGLSSE